jgi:hypothetical protein
MALTLLCVALWPGTTEHNLPDPADLFEPSGTNSTAAPVSSGTIMPQGDAHAAALSPRESAPEIVRADVESEALTVAAKLPHERCRITGHTDSVMSLAFLPDGRILSGSFDNHWGIST